MLKLEAVKKTDFKNFCCCWLYCMYDFHKVSVIP